MKKQIIYLFCAVALVFGSCKKESTPKIEDETLYPVTFSVNTFSTELAPMANAQRMSLNSKDMMASANGIQAAAGTLSESINYLHYLVFNESGINVNEKVVSSTSPNFGTITDELPSGTYNIVVIGSIYGTYHYFSGRSYSSFPLYLTNKGDDVFLAQTVITVGTEAVAESLTLVRETGKMEINILDEVPTNISHVIYTLKNVGDNKYLNRDYIYMSNSVEQTIYVSEFDAEMNPLPPTSPNTNFYYFVDKNPLDEYSNPINHKASLNIRAYTNSGNLVIDKTINDIPIEIRKRTIVSGKLFEDNSSTGGQGFTIDINDVWGEDIIVDF